MTDATWTPENVQEHLAPSLFHAVSPHENPKGKASKGAEKMT